MQFIDSVAVAEVLDKDGSIQNYFKKQAPAEGAPYGISPEVMDNYIKSCGESEPCHEEICFLHKFFRKSKAQISCEVLPRS